jgi:NAD(P)H-flavin reductase
MIIYINNNKYDVTEFVNEHPGGSNVFKDGEDLTKEFEEASHSQKAIKMLEQYLVDEDVMEEPHKTTEKTQDTDKINLDDVSIKDLLFHKFSKTNFSRLFTKEDKGNIHKILGGFALINYIYFFGDVCYSGCKGKMTLRKKDVNLVFSVIPLIILSLSALIFHTPEKLNKISNGMPKTYQYHSILFALRSFVIIIIISFFGNTKFTNFLVVCILFLTMKGADEINRLFIHKEDKSAGQATEVPFWSECPVYIRNIIKKVYVLAQLTFTATAFNTDIETHFSAAFLIQITALLFTLLRKQIITIKGWHLLYLSEYLLVFLLWIRNPQTYVQLLIGTMCYIARVNMRINKYTLWSIYAIIFSFFKYREKTIGSFIQHLVMLIILLSIMNSKNMVFDKKRSTNNNIVTRNNKYSGHHRIMIKIANKFTFYPGQYFNLFVNTEKRPYTPIHISGQNVEFLIKNYENGKISPKICKYFCEGGDVNALGPFGNNYYDPENDSLMINNEEVNANKIIMFCCGTGITPFYSILTTLCRETKYKFRLYASFKSDKNPFLIKEIPTGVAKKKCFYSEDNTKLTKKRVHKILSNHNTSAVLICGTPEYSKMIQDSASESKHQGLIVKW